MRLVIDLQGAQGANAERGIGRYSRELALAMAREARGHEVIVALSGALPQTVDRLCREFAGVLPLANIRLWHPPAGIAELQGSPLRSVAEVLRTQFLASLGPDFVLATSLFEGLGDDVVTCSPSSMPRLPLVAVCHDLIPFVRRDEYFGPGGVLSAGERWYFRTLQEMALCEGLLANSESSRGEAISHLNFPRDRVFNIQAGINSDFRRVELAPSDRERFLARYGITRPFILFLGAGDIRKNEASLIKAFAMLQRHLRSSRQLVLVGKMESRALRKVAAEQGIPSDALVVVQFVEERDLPTFYSACDLFVFPSFHEGFGLPVAEAMACGAPVITSNTSSLPEVVGRPDALFDPGDPADIAQRMTQVLGDSGFRAELAAYGPVQAGRFTWSNSAEKAWNGLEQLRAARPNADSPPALWTAPVCRPRLAFVSPLPPQASGIADYSAELIPALARHYDITLVCEGGTVGDIRLASYFPCLDAQHFAAAANQFDRVLYQIGNSSFHRFQLSGLLHQAPGVAVLHDVFLSGYQNWIAHEVGYPELFRAALYEAHGYPGLQFDALEGRDATIVRFPCSLSVLHSAVGTIVHSEYARTLLTKHFGERAVSNIDVFPHLRGAGPLPSRAAARAQLGLPSDAFIIASFGMVTRHKQPELLLRAWQEAGQPGLLAFVGEALPEQLTQLQASASGSPGAATLRITGRVTPEIYRTWLAAADAAVQLRRDSRGESSGAIADCLAAGLPLIINKHGSAAELPDEVAFVLPAEADEKALADAICFLRDHPTRSKAIAEAARKYVDGVLDPTVVATRYRDSIEKAYARHDQGAVARQLAHQSLPLDALTAAARAAIATFPAPRSPRLLIDISELARRDSRSGIQRVVREVMRRALLGDAAVLRGEAVRIHAGRLRSTHAVPLATLELPPLPLPETPVDTQSGDVLLCIDINAEITSEELSELHRQRLNGLRIVLVVYDTLPMRRPHFFPAGITAVLDWYRQMLLIADDVICISRAVADEIIEWLGEEAGRRDRPLRIGYFHLGADFPTRAADSTLSDDADMLIRRAKEIPTFLMVGTVEPRKGHRQTLAAFERLWQDGYTFNLVIVGKQGWQMEDFAERLRASPAAGKPVFWLEASSDSDLRALYDSCSALVMASSDEGFGLPIVEAYRSGLPVIARDIPVFREVAGAAAAYFSGEEPAALSAAILDWVARDRAGGIPRPNADTVLNWDGSYRQLCSVLFEDNWYVTWKPKPAG